MSRNGRVTVSLSAGVIELSTVPPDDQVGQMVLMGRDLFIHIKPDVARQWIGVLKTITAEAPEDEIQVLDEATK